MTRSKAQWCEFGEKNNKYFYNLEKINHKKKHITSLTKEDGNIALEPNQILEEEERSKNFINPKLSVKNLQISNTFLMAWILSNRKKRTPAKGC